MDASGAGDISMEYGAYDGFQPTHVFGTCRMETYPANPVVDPYGRSHWWRNLVVADVSVFPSSSGGGSPSLTIEALTVHGIRHLADSAKRGEL